MIILKPIEEKYKNADEATKNQLKELALNEALSKAASEEQLKQLDNDLRLVIKGLRNVVEGKAGKNHTHEQPKSQLEPVKEQYKVNEPKEVPSTSLLENIIKLFKK